MTLSEQTTRKIVNAAVDEFWLNCVDFNKNDVFDLAEEIRKTIKNFQFLTVREQKDQTIMHYITCQECGKHIKQWPHEEYFRTNDGKIICSFCQREKILNVSTTTSNKEAS